MYQTCPKCGHTRAASDDSPTDRCPACGILFQKWLRAQLRDERADASVTSTVRTMDAGGVATRIIQSLLHVEPRVNVIEFSVRLMFFVGLAIWGIYFIFTDWASESGPFREIGNSFMHNINLVFHEAGHIIFIPLGNFMSVLGGSLGQLIMPLVVMLTFLLRYQNAFGASVGLWWLAQSMMDLAPYVGDARRGELVLLGGVTGMHAPGYHDWSNLLGRTGLLAKDRIYAARLDTLGEMMMWLAIVWGAVVLYRQFQNLDTRV